ncbi:adenosine deaminase [Streptomyces sp. A7024]|uniref:Adenosine deaminase n=1 Tax=Streptomyces coryli TaxID=1128680 RepID=A0A6G4TWE8_9ACTN|nr:adenosine deaminase [Streptomyces coryli]NGN63367.1 adenosine deaminase [Streptomyces coryli]
MPPRIELHVHLEGTVRPHRLLELARRDDFALPADTAEGVARLYEFRDLVEFIGVWKRTAACLRTPADYRDVLLDYVAEAAAQGAVYLEACLCWAPWLADWAGILAACCDAAEEARERFGVAVGLTPEIYLGCDVAAGEEAARTAGRFAGREVVGFGLAGAEGVRPSAPHERAVAIAREAGLGYVPHAGEAAGPHSVRQALALGAHRLRHGVRAAEDPGLVAELAARGVVLDVALTSNLRLGVTKSLADHPLPQLLAAGVRCTVNTDDPAMFNTNLDAEHAAAARLGLTEAQAYAAGLAGALCDDATRARLEEAGRQAYGRA